MIREFAPEEYYHLYNRGTDKRHIFLDKADHMRFISLLYLCNSGIPIHRSDLGKNAAKTIFTREKETALVDIGAYCLMPNHFHILLREQSEGGISMFIQKLSTAYVMYFNKRYLRKGALFEGRFKSKHVSRDVYLKYLFAYIHLNPIGIIDKDWKEHRISSKAVAKEFLQSYKYSSYLDYAQNAEIRPESAILNKLAFPKYFEEKNDFNTYLKDWMHGNATE
jgi:putative transposase